MNQQSSNRKPGPDNNTPPTGDDPQKKKSKFNIYWVYGIFIVGLIIWNLVRGVSSDGIETDKLKFYQMVKQNDIEKMVVISNKTPSIVRIFVKPDSLKAKEAYYKKLWTDEDAAKNMIY